MSSLSVPASSTNLERWTLRLTGVAVFLAFLLAMAWVQFSTPDMPDNDGFYHIKMAELMRTEGLKPPFRWLPLTVLNEKEFYDHHFLFHVGLIPFTFGDLRIGAKWGAVVFAALAFLSIWLLLQGQGVPYAWLWALGLLSISQAFLYRMSITRAQSLSLAFLAIGLHLLLTRRYRWLLPLGFLYVWLYNAFPLLGVLAVVYTVSVLVVERRFEWQPVVYAGVGIVLGLILNPYFPADLVFIYRHYLPKLTETTAVSVGNEWYPYNTLQLLKNSTLTWLAVVGGSLALGWREEKIDTRTLLSFLLMALFGLMLFQARRFIEYFPPFALIFAAFAVGPLLARLPERRRTWAAVGLGVLALAGAIQMLPQARDSIMDSKRYDTYARASAWLANNTPEGARVFQTDWDDFPRLFFYNTHNTYLVGLDPTYMQLYDAGLYDEWVDITQGRVANPSAIIRDRFGSRYVITDYDHGDFIRVADQDPHLKRVYKDDFAIVYEVTD
jgi:hypothetical protein